MDRVVLDDISGLLRVDSASARELQGAQLAEPLAIGDERADNEHRPLDPVDRKGPVFAPRRGGEAELRG